MDIPILYEDDALLVIDKPPGIVVNNAESVKGETVQDWAALRFKSQITNPNFQKNIDEAHWSLSFGHCDFCSRAGIVHRLDKETSGILLIAKTPEAFIELQRQFKERIVHKTYLALCHGKLEPPEGEIRAPVGRLPWNRERFGIVPGGKEAVTRYRVLKWEDGSEKLDKEVGSMEFGTSEHHKVSHQNPASHFSFPISLVELYPETGRTHQIRVHLKYINHPIIGDYLYAGRKTSRSDREEVGRVMLHAWKIEFLHPTKGDTLKVEAPVPEDMVKIIQ